MSEFRTDRRLMGRKQAAAAGIKTGTTFAYEAVWVVQERDGGDWADRWFLPTEEEARAWAEHGGEPPAPEPETAEG